jgi:hypothetical protein
VIREPLRRLYRVAAIAVVALIVAACPGDAAQLLTDPRDILAQTLVATAQVRSAHARIDMENRPADGNVSGGSVDADVNLADGELAAQGIGDDGAGAFGLIVAGGDLFARGGGAQAWTRIPGAGLDPAAILMGRGGVGGGQPPDYLALLRSVVTDPQTTIELRGVEDCDVGRCYHTGIGLTGAQIWELAADVLRFEEIPGAPARPPLADLPSISIELLSDVATLRLIDLVGTATVNDGSVAIRVRISAFDQEVIIEAPLEVEQVPDFGF